MPRAPRTILAVAVALVPLLVSSASGGGTCATAKLRAAAKAAAGQLKCFATAFPTGPCITAVDQRLTTAFTKADTKFGAGG